MDSAGGSIATTAARPTLPFRLVDLPIRNIPFAQLPYVRGHLSSLTPLAGGTLRVHGWVSAPGEQIDAIQVHHDGRFVAEYETVSRPDVKAAYEWLPYAESSGFLFMLPLSPEQTASTTRLDLVSVHNGRQRGRLSQLVRADLYEFPSPPEELMYRVAHIPNPRRFKVSGFKSIGDFLEALARHADISRTRRILEWGCGCGRMSMFFLSAQDCPEFAGCDIDRRAVAWCSDNLKPGVFSFSIPCRRRRILRITSISSTRIRC